MATKKTTAKKTTAKKTTTKKTPKKAIAQKVNKVVQAPTTKKDTTAKKPKAEKKVKEPTKAHYGVALRIMGANPDMSKAELKEAMTKEGINPDEKPSAVATAYSAVRTCARLFRENKLMK